MRRAIANWWVGTVVLVVLGVAIGGLVFCYVWPGKPKIGVIDIPFTIINDDSSYVIGFLSRLRPPGPFHQGRDDPAQLPRRRRGGFGNSSTTRPASCGRRSRWSS